MSRIVVVTGAASGVGGACMRLLRERGWITVGLDLAGEPMDDRMADLEAGTRIFRCDVSSSAQVDAAFAAIGSRIPSLDALICSAGILRIGSIETMSVEDFDAVFTVNTRGAWLCAKAALPLLRRGASAERPGSIVFVSSVAVLRPKMGTGIYAASKAALSHLTRVLAAEVAPDHILVNALAPGSMDTPMTRHAAADRGLEYRRSDIPPIGRMAVPDDAARAAAMLLSGDAGFITGVTLPVDGGSSAVYIPGAPPTGQ